MSVGSAGGMASKESGSRATSSDRLSPAVQETFDRLLERYPDLDAILLSTADGVPLIRAVRPAREGQEAMVMEGLETRFSAIFSVVADQARKMRHGSCQQVVAFFQGLLLVHVNLPPLVLTFAAREGSSSSGGGPATNVGMLLDSRPLLEEALRGVRAAIEMHEQQDHGGGRM